MFTWYWYWFPLANFVGLALEPTYLVGITKNLKIPRGFKFISKSPKSYFDYYKTKQEEKTDTKKGVQLLSVTKKVLSKKTKNLEELRKI